jgi:hypothetical protein
VLGPSGIGYSYWTYNHDFSNGEGGGTEVGYFYQHSMQDLAELMKSMREVLLEIFPGEVIYRSNVPGAKGKDTWVEDWDEEDNESLWKYHRTHHLTKHPNALLSLYADSVQECIDILGIPLVTWITMRESRWPTHGLLRVVDLPSIRHLCRAYRA